jgi:hypothetical protein
LKFQYDLGGNPAGNPADFRASRPTVAAVVVKGFTLFGIDQMINLAIADLMNPLTKGVADFISEKAIDLVGFFHGFSILFPIFKLFPAHQATDPHDGPGERPASLPHSGNSSGQSTAGLENCFASNVQLFLQSRKNGLASAEVLHVILQGRLKNLIQNLLPICHNLLLSI